MLKSPRIMAEEEKAVKEFTQLIKEFRSGGTRDRRQWVFK